MTTSKNKKLLLISPVNRKRSSLSSVYGARFPPLGLGIIAELTPHDWTVELVDENFEPFLFKDADLVALTAFTSSITRAYEIAKVYREKGVPTIIGGIHASMMPQEALQFVDSVVIGEAEGVWPDVIKDFERGKVKKMYKANLNPQTKMSKARHGIFHPSYPFGSIQTARGCPMDCNFCSVTTFNGNRYRQREISEVLDELETIPQKMLYFVDDNIYGYGKNSSNRAISLFKGIIERGIKKEWFSQASINFAENDEMLKYAAKSGCKMILLGLESDNSVDLKNSDKKLNMKFLNQYKKIFRRIHSHGIAVLGSFIYGMDNDTTEALEKRTQYIVKSKLDAVQISLMTPLPGTKLFSTLHDEGRLLYTNFPDDWQRYDMTEVVFKPKEMKPDELLKGLVEGGSRIYSLPNIYWKYFKTLGDTGKLSAAQWACASNLNYFNVGLKLFWQRDYFNLWQ